jgi:uncharacterized protein (DUF2344 family)
MRLRIVFSKTGALRYTGHLDLQKIWERTARRAGLPLAYSQGFHPQPKIQLAAALPLGFSGRAELVDIWLDAESADSNLSKSQISSRAGSHACDSGAWEPPRRGICGLLNLREAKVGKLRPDIEIALQQAAPPGLGILKVEEVDARAPALQTQVVSAEYEVTLLDPADGSDLTRRLSAVMEAESLPRQRRGKAYDLRPLIETLHFSLHPTPSHLGRGAKGEGPLLFMRLAAREGATGRPEEVLDVLGIRFEATRIERSRLILKS